MTVPMISVVMPVYNAEKYVAEAVESILNQTYSDFEFIIIDDCSTDNSYQILQAYEVKDKRIKLYKNDVNYKQAYTKNRAIELARGKYIAFMDADDISLPERFAKQVEFMELHPEIGVCGTWIKEFFDIRDKRINLVKYPVDNKIISLVLLFDENCLAHPSTIVKRTLFIDLCVYYSVFLGGYAEDYRLWIDLLENGVKFYNIPEFLLLYRKSETQTTVLSKSNVFTSAQLITKTNFYHHFGEYLDEQTLNTYLKLKYYPKKKLTLSQHLYYQYLLNKIKKINSKLNLFDKHIFNKIINKESFLRLIFRYFGSKNEIIY